MKKRAFLLTAVLLLCLSVLTACSSYYALFTDGADTGVYSAIFDENSTEEELAAIPETHLMAGDLRDEIKTCGLSYEVTLSFDPETDDEATLSCYYYHNKEDETAADYCQIGMIYLGTYTVEDDTILFHIEQEDGINTALYTVGSDYADLEAFQQFSFAEDHGNGVWAYATAPWDYEDAVIDSRILDGVPENITFTVEGSKLLTWEAAE